MVAQPDSQGYTVGKCFANPGLITQMPTIGTHRAIDRNIMPFVNRYSILRDHNPSQPPLLPGSILHANVWRQLLPALVCPVL